jgi:quercetin dioxygenase-like cupin family protein
MKTLNIIEAGDFSPKAMRKLLVSDSAYMRILNFNFEAGQELPVHAHEMEGQLSILVLEGSGEFLGKDGGIPAKAGDILVCDIAEPHGVRAAERMRVLVTIAPPI